MIRLHEDETHLYFARRQLRLGHVHSLNQFIPRPTVSSSASISLFRFAELDAILQLS